jgi:hypothetical protein
LEDLEGRPIRYLAPEDEMAYLATHAAGHLLQRAGWLLDLVLLHKAHPELDWRVVAQRARESEMDVPVYLALSVAKTQLGLAVPDAILEELAPDPVRRLAARLLFSRRRLLQSFFAERHRYWSYAGTYLFASSGANAAFMFRTGAERGLKRKLASLAPRWVPPNWRA